MIKTIISSFLLVILLVSCNSNPNVEGFWIQSNVEHPESTDELLYMNDDYKHFINIKGDSIQVKSFVRIRDQYGAIDTTVKFKLENGKIIFDDEDSTSCDITVFKDSMIITFDSNEKTKVTYKKLPKHVKKNDWNPKGKRYKLEVNGQIMYQDYTDDFNEYSHYINETEVYEYRWKLEHIDNYSFLVRESIIGNTPLLIDSISGTKVYLSNYTSEKKNIVLEQQQYINKKSSKLFGDWKLVSKKDIIENDSIVQQYERYSMNDLHKLRIEEDSIKMYNRIWKSKSSWKYYEDEKIISLEMDKQILIKVLQITENKLVLKTNLESNTGTKKQFVFKRE